MAGGRGNKDDKNAAKRSSLQEFGITARQYNIIRALEGKIKSIKERRPGLIREEAIRKAPREGAKRNGEIMGSARPSAVGTLKFEDEEVRITEWRFAPGAATGWHRHGLDYAVVPLLDGRLQVQHPDGSTSFADLKRGIPYGRSEGVEHDVINANAFDYAFLEIELKKRAQS